MKFFGDCEGLRETLVDIKLATGLQGLDLAPEEEREYSPQIFPAHDDYSERVRKSCYYGRLPPTDRPSLPLTRLAVEQFSMVGLHKLSRLDIARAGEMSRDACASPTSLVFALIYLDRLQRRNPDYLRTVSSADLFLVAMMVASKFLYDDGEEDEVFNDEWAKSGHMDVKDFNRLEVEFLAAIDWNVNVPVTEFESALQRIEQRIAYTELSRRGWWWSTYSDLDVLSSNSTVAGLWKVLADLSVRVTTVCMAAYAASIFTLLGSTALLNQTPFGPRAVAESYRVLTKGGNNNENRRDSAVVADLEDSLAGLYVDSVVADLDAATAVASSVARFNEMPDIAAAFTKLPSGYPNRGTSSGYASDKHSQAGPVVSPADLLTASLLVASLQAVKTSSNRTTGKHEDDGREETDRRWQYGPVLSNQRLSNRNNTGEADTGNLPPSWITERTEFIHHATGDVGRVPGNANLLLGLRVPDLHSAIPWPQTNDLVDELDDETVEAKLRSQALHWSNTVGSQWRRQHQRHTPTANSNARLSAVCPLRRSGYFDYLMGGQYATSVIANSILQNLVPISVF